MLVFIWSCIFATAHFYQWEVAEAADSIINTPLGVVIGRHIKSYEGRTVLAFEGIPYAKPPVADLRFKEPQPVDPWTHVLIANRTYTCLQYTAIEPRISVVGDEDCLYLYVYVSRPIIYGNESLDVVVHIHGGAFTVGEPGSTGGPEYIMDRDLVYVSMNYRLGILGFLSTEDDVIRGNYGLKDQVQALKWIKDNIKYFGGNPNSVTLIGTSSGAACVHFHYLSPLSKGLFHRGFSQSGTALNYWALTKHPLKNAKRLGALFECSQKSTETLLECLTRISGRDVTLGLSNFLFLINTLPPNQFVPIIESGPNAFLPDHPYKLLSEGKINDVPWITSNTKDEGIIPVGLIILYGKLQELDTYWNELSPFTLGYNDTVEEPDIDLVARKVRDHYLKNESISVQNILDLIKLYSDRYFIADAVKAARIHSKSSKSPVYYYNFDYQISIPVPFKATLSVIGHGDDAKLLYNQVGNPQTLSDSDKKMKDIFIDFIYKFAKTGKPEVGGTEWKPVNFKKEEFTYMHITSPENIKIESTKEFGNETFWNSLPIKENEKSLK